MIFTPQKRKIILQNTDIQIFKKYKNLISFFLIFHPISFKRI